tara:strand:- start:82 stop:549 length:468 start_codon:yes stop_codon:yes gene_type:complete
MASIETTVIDNWLEPQLAEYLSNILLNKTPYFAGHKSTDEDASAFLYGDIVHDRLINFLTYKIKFIRPVNVLRIYTNLHYNNMGGAFHPDDGDITFLYMPSKNVEGGEFEVKDEEKIEYKFNRLIYFDAKKLHKGHPPINNVPRITLAFKTQSLI